VVNPKFSSADFARPESIASLHNERSTEALLWWSRVKCGATEDVSEGATETEEEEEAVLEFMV
jgi:hypothetical protein